MELLKPGYTRVSEILSIFQAYSFVPREKLKKAQDIGTDIHAAIEEYFNEGFTPLDRKRSPYFESFLKWAAVVNPKPVLLEQRLYDDFLMITGRIDLLLDARHNCELVDFKTGSWAHPDIWRLQGEFYRYLLSANGYPVPEKYIFVQLQKDGSAPVLYEFEHRKEDWDVCLAALKSFRYFNKII